MDFLFLSLLKDGHKAEHPVEMAASPRRQQGMAGSQQLQHQTAGGMHPLSSVATGQIGLQQDRGIHSSPGTGLRSMVVQSDFRKASPSRPPETSDTPQGLASISFVSLFI